MAENKENKTYGEFAMVYALSPGLAWGCDMVKIGAHQSSSMATAMKELRNRYGTLYPELRFMHLCFTAADKFTAEKEVKRSLERFRHHGEVYSGLGCGLEEALKEVYDRLEVHREAAFEHKVSAAKRALLEAADDVAAVARVREARLADKKRRRLEEKEESEQRMQREAVAAEAAAQKDQAEKERRRAAAERNRLSVERWKCAELNGQDCVKEWVSEHTRVEQASHFTLAQAYAHFVTTWGAVPQRKFKHRIENILAHTFRDKTRVAGVCTRNVFTNMVLV